MSEGVGESWLTFGVLDSGDQVHFREGRDAFVHAAAAAQAGYLGDQGRWHDFVVFAAHFHLRRASSAVSLGASQCS